MDRIELIGRYHRELKGSDLKEAPRRDKFLVLLQALFPSSVEELRRLAALGETASKAVTSAVQSGTTAGTLGTRRRLARESAAAQLEEIDKLVKGLLSPHHD